ncbi:MAG: glycosyltransferase family A protein [Candidatus Electrothrix aestuarii]|uniref:Glycosyltransferase family A protein n=1 Tax=Candidatus Electrothrix aestuarii TaxID=3062594 RepID=A0AAU8M1Y7_9BACT|nr:glycosyltransferase family A protein [Candidatus Electrothrix aestuarii]
MTQYKYNIITPVYNEARFLPFVIRSIIDQTHPPEQWVIVDDRSTDNTWSLITEAAEKYPLIQPVSLSGDTARRLGPNVVHVFNKGYDCTKVDQLDFTVKMDADVVLPKQYFEFLLKKFAADEKLGIASGKTFILKNDRWQMERCPNVHTVGPCKMYRLECFRDIGGLIPILGWDKLDGAKARMKGWRTHSARELPVYHLRQMGGEMGAVKTYLSYGKSCYYLREGLLFALGRAIYRSMERPYFSGLFIFIGYIVALLKQEERLDDPELASFFKKEQLRRLSGVTIKQEELFAEKIGEDKDKPFALSLFEQSTNG